MKSCGPERFVMFYPLDVCSCSLHRLIHNIHSGKKSMSHLWNMAIIILLFAIPGLTRQNYFYPILSCDKI